MITNAGANGNRPLHHNMEELKIMGIQTATKWNQSYQKTPRKVYGSDRIGIVGYHDYGFVIAKPADPFSAWLQTRTHELRKKVSGSSTNITDGLRKSVEMLKITPIGVLRRIWLLTDGYPNRDVSSIMDVVNDAHRNYINVNTIGFGDTYDENLLRQISGGTHNGRFYPVSTLRQLTQALTMGANTKNGPERQHHRAETTILAIDLSGSMLQQMGDKAKIAVVEEAILHLINYKQKCFA